MGHRGGRGAKLGNDRIDMGLTYNIDDSDSHPSQCGICRKEVRTREKGVQCDLCFGWFHLKCGSISEKMYIDIEEISDIEWYCKGCRDAAREGNTKIVGLTRENTALKEENECLKTRLAVIESKVDEIKQELKSELIEEVNRKFEQVMSNFQDKEGKKDRVNNLIRFNVIESTNENGKEREKDDFGMCNRIFTEGVGIQENEYNIKSVIRLGKRSNEENQIKQRPLLVKLENLEQKWLILRNAKRLRNNENLKNCIIALDLTKEEREQDKKLRSELKAKRDNGETNWFIKRGKLMKRNFQ